MNPVLLKPTGERTSRSWSWAVPPPTRRRRVLRRPRRDWSRWSTARWPICAARFDVVVCEGAGSPAEINLLEHDIVNLGLARRAGIAGRRSSATSSAAACSPTSTAPSPSCRPSSPSLVRGFVINRFRGDPALLGRRHRRELEARCGVPTLGRAAAPRTPGPRRRGLVGPVGSGRGTPAGPPPGTARIDVAAIRLPRLSNFTDLDPLAAEPGVRRPLGGAPRRAGRPRPDRRARDQSHRGRPGVAAHLGVGRRARGLAGPTHTPAGARHLRGLPDAGPDDRATPRRRSPPSAKWTGWAGSRCAPCSVGRR